MTAKPQIQSCALYANCPKHLRVPTLTFLGPLNRFMMSAEATDLVFIAFQHIWTFFSVLFHYISRSKHYTTVSSACPSDSQCLTTPLGHTSLTSVEVLGVDCVKILVYVHTGTCKNHQIFQVFSQFSAVFLYFLLLLSFLHFFVLLSAVVACVVHSLCAAK